MPDETKSVRFNAVKFAAEAQHDPTMLDSLSEKDLRKLDEVIQDPEVEGGVHLRAKVAEKVHALNVEADVVSEETNE